MYHCNVSPGVDDGVDGRSSDDDDDDVDGVGSVDGRSSDDGDDDDAVLLAGTYFARDASYAHEYTDVKMMNLSKGDVTGSQSAADTAAAADADAAAAAAAADANAGDTAVDSEDVTRQLRVMVAARVFVGRYTVGHRTYRKPPALNLSQPFSTSFDSCVNYIDNPTLFVVFDSSQCYPEYFITYCCN